MFQVKKEGSKQNILVSDFIKYVCNTNIRSTTSSAKIAIQNAQKPESWCATLKGRQLQHLNVNLFCALDSL